MSSRDPHEGAPAWRVVLVDDHALMREGIRTILSTWDDIEVVGQAGTGEEAQRVVRATRPDVVCMDVEMPGMGGLEATRRLVADPDVAARILVLTTFEREDYLLAALEAGASAFLLKNSRPEQLADGIRAVAAGEALLAPELTRAVIERAVARERDLATPPGHRTGVGQGVSQGVSHGAGTGPTPAASVHPAGPGAVVLPLSEREREVLQLLATGMSNEEIAAALVLGRATIKTHVSNVLAKLGLRDRVQAVAYAYRAGIVPLP